MERSRLFNSRFLVGAMLMLVPGMALGQGATLFGGLGYFQHVEQVGATVGIYVPVSGDIEAGGNLSYWFSKETDGGDETALHVNGNLRYPIVRTGANVYVLGGVNVYRWDWESSDGDFKEDDTIIGANAGTMAEFGSGNVGFFVLAKMILSNDTSFVGGAGVTIGI